MYDPGFSTLLTLLLRMSSLIWVRLLAVCLPCPLHILCQSWRGQDQEGPPVRPECCTHMCHGISPQCHLCGWWCRWTRRWCPWVFWLRCGTGSSRIWHHCRKKRSCECHEYNHVQENCRMSEREFRLLLSYLLCETFSELQQIILSARH